MDIFYSTKTMEEIIGYWIEAVHISSTLERLCEYTDEVAEIYDTREWLKNNPKIGEASYMSLVDSIDETANQATDIWNDAEEYLIMILTSAIENGVEKFDKYQNTDYVNKMDDLCTELFDEFDRIYAYTQKEQIDNFYQVLFECMDKIFL